MANNITTMDASCLYSVISMSGGVGDYSCEESSGNRGRGVAVIIVCVLLMSYNTSMHVGHY